MQGQEIHCRPVEVKEGTERHSGQPELVDRNNEEHCASHRRVEILTTLTKMRN